MIILPYLQGYPEPLLDKVRGLIAAGRLNDWLIQRYPGCHGYGSDKALWDYVQSMKTRHLRHAPPLNKVLWDNKIHVIHHALGLHSSRSQVQGSRLKSRAEIRIASRFRQAPEPFLQMIVAHELAHIKEKQHDKAFYQLCCHILPDYHQLEFDTRLWLTMMDN